MTGDLTLTGNKDVIIQGTGNLSVGGNATVGADLTVDTNTLYVDSTDSRVAMGHTDPKQNSILLELGGKIIQLVQIY